MSLARPIGLPNSDRVLGLYTSALLIAFLEKNSQLKPPQSLLDSATTLRESSTTFKINWTSHKTIVINSTKFQQEIWGIQATKSSCALA